MVPENIHTYPREDYWKFQGEGRTQKSKSKNPLIGYGYFLEQQIKCTDLAIYSIVRPHKLHSLNTSHV